MESISSVKKERVAALLQQIQTAIQQLREWNRDIHSANDYYLSTEGMRNLAADCMLVEAIGEGFKQIDKLTEGRFLTQCEDIPWEDVIGIRNHIAHGYFDIDAEVVFSTIQNDLPMLEKAVDFLLPLITA